MITLHAITHYIGTPELRIKEKTKTVHVRIWYSIQGILILSVHFNYVVCIMRYIKRNLSEEIRQSALSTPKQKLSTK